MMTRYRAFTDQNPDLVDEAVSADWLDLPPALHQAPGPEGIKPIIRAFAAAFPDLRIGVHETFGSAGRIGVRAEIVGTHRGEWSGVARTGKPVRIALHEFHHLRDGRITHTGHLEDWSGMLGQVGAWPPSERWASTPTEKSG